MAIYPNLKTPERPFPNTENAGGTRFSAGKPKQVWAPWLGLDLVWGLHKRVEELGYIDISDEDGIDQADLAIRHAMSDPTSRDKDGILYVVLAAHQVLQSLHTMAGGSMDDRLPTLGLDFMCEVSVMGAAKYAPFDYRNGQSFSTLLSSAYRHLRKVQAKGSQALDEESGLKHLAHVAWNLLCILEFIALDRMEFDDITPWRGITTAMKNQAAVIADEVGCPIIAVLREYHAGLTKLGA